MPVFLFFGCQSVVQGEFHDAVSAFCLLGLYAALFIQERTKAAGVRRSARGATGWVFALLAIALAVFLGLVTGLWMLAILAILVFLMLEGWVDSRAHKSVVD